MTDYEKAYNIPLKSTEDKVVFEIIIDKKVHTNISKLKDPIDILITIKTNSDDLEFDVLSKNK